MKLRTLLVSLMLLIGASAPINAQVIAQVQPGRNSAALSSSSTGTCLYTTDCNRINLGGYASVAVQLSGTWTGTATFETTTTVPGTAEASTTWVAVYLTPSNGSVLTTTATTGGIWYGTVIGTQFRVRLTTPTGTMTSTIMTTLSAATNLGSSHTGSFLLADGTAALPSAAFASHPSYGLFLDGNTGVDVSINGTARYSFRGDGLALDPTYGLEWTSGNPSSTNPDLVLLRDAANTLALRNGANAQVYNVYNTFTSGTSYERGFFRWVSNVLEFGVEKGSGGGSPRDLRIVSVNTAGSAADVFHWDGTSANNVTLCVSNCNNVFFGTSAGWASGTGAAITKATGTGLSVVVEGGIRETIYKTTVSSTAFVCAATTCDVTIATLPAKTFVKHALADLTQTFACTSICTTSTLSMVLGKTAGGNQYLLSFDADAVTGQFGDAAAELGASIAPATVPTEDGDLASWTTTTGVVLRLTSGTGNIGTGAASNLSQGSVTLYITVIVKP